MQPFSYSIYILKENKPSSVSLFSRPTSTMLFSAISTCFLFLLPLYPNIVDAANFDIRNNCAYTVWAGAVPGGGQRLDSGQTWSLNVPAGTTQARIWPRTNCNFDASGRGKCETGDCNGLLQCKNYGTPPNSMVEYALNQYDTQDFFDISLVDGFNVPIEFSPNSGGCSRGIRCTADIYSQCPTELQARGGCNNPCTVFQTDEYCCTSTNSSSCGPTKYSKFFKDRCPDAYSYPMDDQASMFTCPAGTNYRVVFCPSGAAENGYRSLDMCSRTSVLKSVTKFGSVIAC